MVGFARTLPYASSPCGQQKVYFQDQDFSIVYADPRALIIRLASDCLRALIVAAHAPHSGNSDEQLAEWWEQLSPAIPAAYRDWTVTLLVDANAMLAMICPCTLEIHMRELMEPRQIILQTSSESMRFGCQLPLMPFAQVPVKLGSTLMDMSMHILCGHTSSMAGRPMYGLDS